MIVPALSSWTNASDRALTVFTHVLLASLHE